MGVKLEAPGCAASWDYTSMNTFKMLLVVAYYLLVAFGGLARFSFIACFSACLAALLLTGSGLKIALFDH